MGCELLDEAVEARHRIDALNGFDAIEAWLTKRWGCDAPTRRSTSGG
jgi:hypothetical protein